MTNYMPRTSAIDFVDFENKSRGLKQKDGKLKQTALEFEGMLMTQLFQTLRKTVEPSGLFGDNQTSRSTYEYLMDQATFQKAAESGRTWGLAARLEESWKMLEEAMNSTSEAL